MAPHVGVQPRQPGPAAEREFGPAPAQPPRRHGRLEGADRPPQHRRGELLTGGTDLDGAGVGGHPFEVGGIEGVQVDDRLQRRGARRLVELGLWTSPIGQERQLGDVGRDPPGQRRELTGVPVACCRRFAGEHEPPAGLEHAHHLSQRQLDVGDVVEHRVPDHQVEGVVVVGDALGVGDPAVDVQTERLPVAGGHLDHAGREIGHRSAPCHPGLDQVQQEEPGTAAQLQGPVVGQLPLGLFGYGGVEATARIVDAALVVGDRPFVVVGLGLPVVVEHLGELGVVHRGFDLLLRRVRRRSRDAGVLRFRHAGQPNC